MLKEQVIQKITDVGIVAVVRAESADQAKKIADACIAGGVPAIELTFTVPHADKVIAELSEMYTEDEIILGDEKTAKLCNRYRVPYMPGCMTIKEVVAAMEAGADIIKIFPGEVFGPKIIKAINGPIPQARMMPTGGVSVDNVDEWIKAGAVACGAGGALTAGAKTGDYAAITETAKKFVENIKKARAK